MCRSHGEPCGGRRCKNTEQERVAKANYRARVKLKEAYSSQVSAPTSESSYVPVEQPVQVTREERIASLLEEIDSPQGDLSDALYSVKLSEAYVKLGEVVAEDMAEVEDKLERMVAEEEANREELANRLKTSQDAYASARDAEEEMKHELHFRTGLTDVYPDANEHDSLYSMFPIISERQAEIEKNFPEDAAALKAASERTLEAHEEYKKAVADRNHASIMLTVGPNSEWDEAFKERREAYMEALKNVGVELSTSTVVASDSSSAPALKVLNGVMQYFPKEWVDSSNAKGESLVVKPTKGRAGYTNNARQKAAFHNIDPEYHPEGWEPDMSKPEYLTARKLGDEDKNADGSYSYVDEATGRTVTVGGQEGQEVWIIPKYSYYESSANGVTVYEPRSRKGWESFEIDALDESVNPPVRRVHTRWRKASTKSIMSTNKFMSELTISGTTPDEKSSVAAHEFCHRVEHMRPEIARAEKAFLSYRSKQHTDTPEKLETITGSEIGYKGGFVTHYAGRVYDGKAFEILSVGIEMLLYGKHGGFQGRGKHSEDKEHRNFILGLMASSRAR